MKIKYTKIYLTIILLTIGICQANSENEGYCSIDTKSEGSCSLPSSKKKLNINTIINNIKEKIKPSKLKRQIEWENDFNASNSNSLVITSQNSTLLTTGTWLIQFYSPWCPFSRAFQRNWKMAIEKVKEENQRLLLENIKIKELNDKIDNDNINSNNEKTTEENNKNKSNNKNTKIEINKSKEMEKEKEKKKLYFIPKDLKFAMVDSIENTDLAALFEIKGYPTIKMIHNGNVITYMNTTSVDILVDFATKGWTEQNWYNRLPKRHSRIYQYQLILSNYLMYMKYYIDENVMINGQLFTVVFALFMAYSLNIVGIIRYGLKNLSNYIQAVIPEMLEVE